MNTEKKELNPRDLLKPGLVVRVRFPHGNEVTGIIIGYRLQGDFEDQLAIYDGGSRAFYISKNVEIIKIVNPVNEDNLVGIHYKNLLESSNGIYQKKETCDALGKIININDKIIYPVISEGRVEYKSGEIVDIDNKAVKIRNLEGYLFWEDSDQIIKV